MDPPVQGDPPSHGLAVPSERMLGDVALEFGRHTYRRRELELVAVQQIDHDPLTLAQPACALRHRSEHGAGIRGGPAQGDQDRIGRRQLLDDLVIMQAVIVLHARLLIFRGHPLSPSRRHSSLSFSSPGLVGGNGIEPHAAPPDRTTNHL